jgi:hypothetical protein
VRTITAEIAWKHWSVWVFREDNQNCTGFVCQAARWPETTKPASINLLTGFV